MPSISCGIFHGLLSILFNVLSSKTPRLCTRTTMDWDYTLDIIHITTILLSTLLPISKIDRKQCIRLLHCPQCKRLLMEDWMIVAINFLGTLHMIMPHCQGCRRWLTILNNIWSGIFWTTGRDVGHLVRWQELGAVPDHEQLDFVRVSSFKPCPTSVGQAHCADCTEKLSPLDQ